MSKSPLLSTTRQLGPFLLTMLVLWMIGGIFLLIFGYEESFLLINSVHHPVLDELAWVLTHFADAIILVPWIFFLMWHREKSFPVLALVLLIGTGIVAQILKNTIFDGWDRPPLALEGHPGLTVVGHKAPRHHAFPSGHATSFFAGALVFAWYVRSWKAHWQVLVALTGAILCFTRVVLGVHFFGDIYAGSIIGTVGGFFLLYGLQAPLKAWFDKIPEEKWRVWNPFLYGLMALIFAVRLGLVWYPGIHILEPLHDLDHRIFLFFNGLHAPWLDEVMHWVSHKWAWIPVYVILLLVLLKTVGWRKTLVILGLVVPLVAATDLIASSLFKPTIGRLRPCHDPSLMGLVHLYQGKCGGQFGFVSSHASNFFGLATFMALGPFRERKWGWWVFFGCAVLVAYSRVYLGVHFPGDVLGGAMLGFLVGMIVAYGYRILESELKFMQKS